MAIRFFALTAVFTLFFGGIGFNLYRLQIGHGAEFAARVQAREEFSENLQLRRGTIYFTDRSGAEIPVSQNRDYPVIYAVPATIVSSSIGIGGTASALAPVLGMGVAALEKSISNPTIKFRALVDKATAEQTAAVEALAIPGISVTSKQYRYYPYERLGSQLIGFVGSTAEQSNVGLYGLEKREHTALAAGDPIVTTIDRNLQGQAEETLRKLVLTYKATGGTVIIAEPATGKILAMASNPDFDPNQYQESSVSAFVNPATQFVYEPGSVMKSITMAAGIDLGILTPETTFNDAGSITLNGKRITNYDGKAYGIITMTTVLEHSVNTGAVFAEQKIGGDFFYDYLRKFGFGEKLGVDLPDEVQGNLRNLERKSARPIDFATAAYGQGLAVTPVQLIAAYGALANGGLLMRPYVIADEKPFVIKRSISEDTSRKVGSMLESTVTKAKVAAIPGYRVAGKTGTALIPDKGGYSDEMIHTFVGYAPVSNPKFVILVKADRPQVGELAGLTVVPAFRDLMQYALNYESVPPDSVTAATSTKP